ASDDNGSGRAARGAARISTDVGDKQYELLDGELGAELPFAAFGERDSAIDFVATGVVEGGSARQLSSGLFEVFDTGGHGGQESSPTLERGAAAQLAPFQVAAA